MKNGLFEKLIRQRVKHNRNKTKIKLYINNDTEIFNIFSILTDENKNILKNDNGKISNDIIDYLINETANIPQKDSLLIIVETIDKTKIKIEFIEKLIKENIKKRMLIKTKELKRINRNSFIFALIGMILISITQVLQIMENRYSFKEFIIVMSWVFMWKAVELRFFERAKLRNEGEILIKIRYSEIIMEE